jgi:RND family efflux transporter MFP subunit
MKTKIISLALIILMVACHQDKQAELVKLKKDRDVLNEKIKTIEDELTKTDSSNLILGTRVAVTELKPSPFNHYIEVQGRVDGDENVNVSTQMGGIVNQIFVKEGDHVSKGQVLAKLDDKVLQRNMVELQTGYDFANSMYEKQKALWDQKIGSEVQYLTAKNNKEGLERRIATLKDQIAQMSITSPVDGNVEDIPLKIGQMMAPGIIAFRVVNFSTIKVMADIAEAYTSQVNNGDIVKVFFPDLKKEVIGKINFSSKFINPTNRTFSVTVRLADVDPNLKANMIAVLKINDYKNLNALVVPVNVVQTDQTGSYVAIAEKSTKGNIVKKVEVTPGIIYNGLSEIKSGLKPGDKIITTGYLDLEDGQAINF